MSLIKRAREAAIRRGRVAAAHVLPGFQATRRDPSEEFVRFGLFDLAYYRAQLTPAKRPASLEEARRHYVDEGRRAGLAMHPFIEPEWWDENVNTDRDDPLGRERWLIEGGQLHSSTAPLVADPDGPIGVTRDYLLGVLDGTRSVALPDGRTPAQVAAELTAAVEESIRTAPNVGKASGVDWSAVAESVSVRVRDRISILVPTYQDWRMTVQAVRAALNGAPDHDLEVVVVDNGSRLAVLRHLLALFMAEPRVRIIRCSENTNFAGGMNRAIAESTGEFILLLNNDAVLDPGWAAPLVAPLRADQTVRGTQPLLMYPGSNRVQAAGTVFLGEGVLPWHFLAGHPREDAVKMRDVSFAAVTAAVMALRAADVVAARGFDEEFENGYEDVDLCLRLRRDDTDRYLVVTEAVAVHPEGSSPGRSTHDSMNRVRFFARWAGRMPASDAHHYAEIGMRLDGMRPLWFSEDVPILVVDPHVVRPARRVRRPDGHEIPCLRWLLLTDSAPPAALDAAAAALAQLGQETVRVASGVHWSDALADVVVGFSAQAATFPRAGAFNVLVGPAGSDAPVGVTLTGGSAAEFEALTADYLVWREELFPVRKG